MFSSFFCADYFYPEPTKMCMDVLVSPDVLSIAQFYHMYHCQIRSHTPTLKVVLATFLPSFLMHYFIWMYIYQWISRVYHLLFFLFKPQKYLQCPCEPNFWKALTQTNEAIHWTWTTPGSYGWDSMISSSGSSSMLHLVLLNTWSITLLPSTGTEN